MVRDTIGHELSCHRWWEGIHLVSQVTGFYVFFYIATDPWPPEVAGDKFCPLLLARVASDKGVMMGFHNFMPKLTIKGDIDLSSIEY